MSGGFWRFLTIPLFVGLYNGSAFAVADECEFIRERIHQLPPTGGTVLVEEGTFNCAASVVIDKSNVRLIGAGRGKTILRLKDWVHAPLMVIGDTQTVFGPDGFSTSFRVRDIEVRDFTLDGNKVNHDVTHECGETHCGDDATSIRNNALTIRGASFVRVVDVTTKDSISGGLVTEKHCDHLEVVNFESTGNYFDGFAGYETEDSDFINVNLHHNRSAGISIDIQFNNNRFYGGVIESNGDVGVFARDLSGNLFDGISILNSGNHGVFLAAAYVNGNNEPLCAVNNTFKDVTIANSKYSGMRINDDCPGNVIIGNSLLENNPHGCVSPIEIADRVMSPSTICR